MSKRSNKSKKQAQNQRNMLIGAAVALIILVIGAVLVLTGQDDTADESTTGGLISPAEYTSDFSDSNAEHMLIDVRTPQEFAEGHIQGAVNIPVDVIDQYTSELPEDMPIVLYCRSGNRSGQAMNILQNAGFENLYDIDGGTIAWSGAGLGLVTN